jgi:chemotaxis protein CheD
VLRLWDREHRRWSARILPGQEFVTRHDEFISAVVGSSIAVCLRDPAERVGGMRLVMLPASGSQEGASKGMKADLTALRNCHGELTHLIGELTKVGASRERLKARIFGGMRGIEGVAEAAAMTTVCVRQFLRDQGIPVVGERLGDTHPRLISFSPTTGTVAIKRLASRYAAIVSSKEMQYFNNPRGLGAIAAESRAS